MAGVFERIIGPERRLVKCPERTLWSNPKVLELQTAMEILAEVFDIRTSEVEEMLRERSKAGIQSCKSESALWPEDFCLAK